MTKITKLIPESDIVKGLKKLTEHGVKLRDIETTVGMPLNSLSRNLKTGKIPAKYKDSLFEYLKGAEIEIMLGKRLNSDIIMKSLAALDSFITNVSQEDKERILKEVKDMKIGGPSMKEFFRDMMDFGVGIYHTDDNGVKTGVPAMSSEEQKVVETVEIQKQIDSLEKEKNAAPKDYSVIGKKVWVNDRQKKIDELKKLLK